MWADALLDYFMLLDSEDHLPAPPEPPPTVNLDRPIDEKGHSAIDRKSTRLNSSHSGESRMPSSA